MYRCYSSGYRLRYRVQYTNEDKGSERDVFQRLQWLQGVKWFVRGKGSQRYLRYNWILMCTIGLTCDIMGTGVHRVIRGKRLVMRYKDTQCVNGSKRYGDQGG